MSERVELEDVDVWLMEECPRVEFRNGSRVWCLYGHRHRTDGPACEWSDGGREWWVNGLRHRVDGPAVERANGQKQWWQKGQFHRADGPAIEYADGEKEWWFGGDETTELIVKMRRLYRRWALRRFVRRCARRWALKCAIEWRPPRGVQFAAMLEGMDGSL